MDPRCIFLPVGLPAFLFQTQVYLESAKAGRKAQGAAWLLISLETGGAEEALREVEVSLAQGFLC